MGLYIQGVVLDKDFKRSVALKPHSLPYISTNPHSFNLVSIACNRDTYALIRAQIPFSSIDDLGPGARDLGNEVIASFDQLHLATAHACCR